MSVQFGERVNLVAAQRNSGRMGTSTNDPRRGASTPAGDLTATQLPTSPGGIVAAPQDTRDDAHGKGIDAS